MVAGIPAQEGCGMRRMTQRFWGALVCTIAADLGLIVSGRSRVAKPMSS